MSKNTKKEEKCENQCVENGIVFTILFPLKYFYVWLFPLIGKALFKTLRFDDLPRMPSKFNSDTYYERFKRIWNSLRRMKRIQLLASIAATFGPLFLSSVFYQILSTFLSLSYPFFLSYMLDAMKPDADSEIKNKMDLFRKILPTELSPNEDLSKLGYRSNDYMIWVWLLVMVIAQYGGVIFQEYATDITSKIGLRVRVLLATVIFEKRMNMSIKSCSKFQDGQVMNYVGQDLVNVEEAISNFSSAWGGFFLIGSVFLMLAFFLKLGALIGFLCSLLLLFFGLGINMCLMGNMKRYMKIQDKRLSEQTEVFRGIETIKYFNWESIFLRKILKTRKRELIILRIINTLKALLTALIATQPPMLMTTSFFFFYLIYQEVDVVNFMTSLAYFNLIRAPLIFMPQTLVKTMLAMVSLRRIQGFLHAEEEEEVGMHDEEESEHLAVKITDGKFSWPAGGGEKKKKKNKDLMNGINNGFEVHGSLEIPKGSLTIICGTVGSGKSSLLKAIIGSMPKDEGDISTSTDNVSYTQQRPFMMNSSVLDNVVFFSEYDEKKLERVLYLSGLKEDMKVLGDLEAYEVGENGSNLSGGQKSRIGLARALYKDGEIILLDDVLSAVDTVVETHIFNECIRKYLLEEQNRTVILVTHLIQYCKYADNVVFMKDGEMISGTYGEIMEMEDDEIQNLMSQNIEEEEVHQQDEVQKQHEQEEEQEIVVTTMEEVNIIKNYEPSRTEEKEPSSSSSSSSEEEEEEEEEEPGKEVEDQESSSKNEEKEEEQQQKQKEPGKEVDIIQKPVESGGTVSIKTYLSFMMRSGGPCVLFFLLVTFFASMSVYVVNDWWVSNITNKDFFIEKPDNTYTTTYCTYRPNGTSSSSSSSMNTMIITEYRDDVNENLDCPIETALDCNCYSKDVKISWKKDYDSGRTEESGMSVLLAFVVLIFLSFSLPTLFCCRACCTFHLFVSTSQKTFVSAFKGVLGSRLSFFETNPLGQIVSRFSDDVRTLDIEVPQSIYMSVGTFVGIISSIILMSILTYGLFIPISLFVMIGYLCLFQIYRRTSRRLKRIGLMKQSVFLSDFSESALSGRDVIKAFKKLEPIINKNRKKLNDATKSRYLLISASRWVVVYLNLLGSLVVLLAAILSIIVAYYWESLGIPLSFLYLNVARTTSFSFLFAWSVFHIIMYEVKMSSYQRIHKYTQLEPEEKKFFRKKKKRSKMMMKIAEGEIEFKNVSMKYQPNLPLVLKGLSFTIPAKSKIGVIGRTGSGKSSLYVSLMRIVELFEGKIEIDGVDTKDVSLSSLRSSISMIHQVPVLFEGTIRSNLDIEKKFKDHEIMEVIDGIPGLAEVLGEEGLGKKVDMGGTNFSVGERQLLSLVRALLKKTKVLLLDECSSSVDLKNDRILQEYLRNLEGLTIITIAHRLRTIIHSDIVIVMDQGRIGEMGSLTELVEKKGLFYEYVLQSDDSDQLFDSIKQQQQQQEQEKKEKDSQVMIKVYSGSSSSEDEVESDDDDDDQSSSGSEEVESNSGEELEEDREEEEGDEESEKEESGKEE